MAGYGQCIKKDFVLELPETDKESAYPQSPSLCEPGTVSDAKVVGGGGTDVTCCQVGTKICCARFDQACWEFREANHLDLVLFGQ